MAGFVGSQARKRRRNRIFFVFSILFLFILFFYLPTLDLTTDEKTLPDEILPDPVDDKSSLISEIEELKLAVFQKDQRIKFRDNQIKDLRNEIKIIEQSLAVLENEYNKTIGNFSELENNLSENSTEKLKQIKKLEDTVKELNNLVKNYEQQIAKFKQETNNSISSEDFQKINIENSILKNEIILMNEKNLRSENLLQELQDLIEEKQKEIDKLIYLKDLGHHG